MELFGLGKQVMSICAGSGYFPMVQFGICKGKVKAKLSLCFSF